MNPTVKKRAVFFLGGFDPRGGRHYYSLFKEEAEKMARVSGAKISVSKRKREKKNVTYWQIEYQEKDDQPVHTEYRVLEYTDIIANHWPRSNALVIKKMLSTYYLMWKKGVFRNEWNVVKPIVYAASFFLILTAWLTFAWLLLTCATWFFLEIEIIWKTVIALAIAYALWVLGNQLDKKFNHYWLIRGICFSGSQAQYDDPAYEERMHYFADQVIAADQSENYEEIVIVGHSSGAIWGMETSCRASLKDKKLGTRKAEVNLLTLGSCIALMSSTKIDKGSHYYIEKMAKCKTIDWIDLSARIDLAASFMVDPASLIEGVELPDPHLPRMFKIPFFKLYSKEPYQAFKKDRYKVHFQYLMSSEIDEAYNYFRIIGSNQTLRFYFN